MSNNNENLLVHIAQLYYHQHLNQNEIAKVVGLSRPTISRMLDEARQLGIVEIIVHDPIRKNAELSAKIRDYFSLKEAFVISGHYKHDVATDKCATEAAQFIPTILSNNMTIGFSWGRAIRSVCDKFQSRDYYNVSVIQMAGCLSVGDPTYDGLELAINVARKFNASYSNIIAPIYVDHETIQSALMDNPQISSAINKTHNLDIALTGIGTFEDPQSSVRFFIDTEEQMQQVIESGAVGHVLARWYNKDGKEVPFPNHYVISAPLDSLKEATWSIGIAASKPKAAATLGALNGGLINCLITDESLAIELLRLAEE